MCFLMVVGYAPFRGKNPKEIIENVRKAKVNWNTPRWKQASKACLVRCVSTSNRDGRVHVLAALLTCPLVVLLLFGQNFTKALLTVQESKRLSAEEALRHEWLTSTEDELIPNFSDQMLVNMSNFADTAKLKQLAKVVIAHCAHRDFVQPYHDAFFAIDHDRSGV